MSIKNYFETEGERLKQSHTVAIRFDGKTPGVSCRLCTVPRREGNLTLYKKGGDGPTMVLIQPFPAFGRLSEASQ